MLSPLVDPLCRQLSHGRARNPMATAFPAAGQSGIRPRVLVVRKHILRRNSTGFIMPAGAGRFPFRPFSRWKRRPGCASSLSDGGQSLQCPRPCVHVIDDRKGIIGSILLGRPYEYRKDMPAPGGGRSQCRVVGQSQVESEPDQNGRIHGGMSACAGGSRGMHTLLCSRFGGMLGPALGFVHVLVRLADHVVQVD